jgi:leucyl/phenylalanyl-tRNA--protein transferase
MPIAQFPPVEEADDSGLLGIGGDVSVPSLLLAYQSGIFPWPIIDDDVLAWFAPPERSLLFLEEFHIPRSLQKERKKSSFQFTIDRAFDQVIHACSQAENRYDSKGRPQNGTWITEEMVAGYQAFHQAGYAHSVECWDGSDLVGGLYGVSVGGMFAGESMFHKKSNASKLALLFLVDFLKEHSVPWIDCQVMTPLFESFGARDISRDAFMRLLKTSLSKPAPFPSRPSL